MVGKKVNDPVKEHVKDELESLGERAGKRIGQCVSQGGDKRAGEIGRKLGKTVGQQLERVHGALEKENVTNEEQLGVGGKVGTGLGIIGKRLVEKRYGFLGKLIASPDLISQGRVMGAKAEKLIKRTVKSGIKRMGGSGDPPEGGSKGRKE